MTAGFEKHWIELLRQYEADIHYEHVLAGHGSPTDRAGIATMIDYVERGSAIAKEVSSREAFIEAMRSAFPDKTGMKLIELVARLNYDH